MDPKPTPRIRDIGVFKQFHARDWGCISCPTYRGIQAHHVVSRSQGGDDVLENLVPLCLSCHAAYHGSPYRAWGVVIDANHVESSIAQFLLSEPGSEHLRYVRGKLGPGRLAEQFGIEEAA